MQHFTPRLHCFGFFALQENTAAFSSFDQVVFVSSGFVSYWRVILLQPNVRSFALLCIIQTNNRFNQDLICSSSFSPQNSFFIGMLEPTRW
jgi:hypothetical protein